MIQSTHTICNECPDYLICWQEGECVASKRQSKRSSLGQRIKGFFTGEDARKKCEGLSSAEITEIARQGDESNDQEMATPREDAANTQTNL